MNCLHLDHGDPHLEYQGDICLPMSATRGIILRTSTTSQHDLATDTTLVFRRKNFYRKLNYYVYKLSQVKTITCCHPTPPLQLWISVIRRSNKWSITT